MRRHKKKKKSAADTLARYIPGDLMKSLKLRRGRPKHGKKSRAGKKRRGKRSMASLLRAERKAFPPGYGFKALPPAR